MGLLATQNVFRGVLSFQGSSLAHLSHVIKLYEYMYSRLNKLF